MAKARANRAEPTNADRAAAAGAALAMYSRDDDAGCALIDLLTDLQHWAAAEGESFENALETARMHFEHEQAEG